MRDFRCKTCSMPSSGGTLYDRGRICGSCLFEANADLKRRMASIRHIIKRASHDPDTMAVVRELLDLRRPLPRKKGGST